MKFPRIIEAVYWQPWLITAPGHAAVRALLENRLSESYRAGMFDMDDEDDEQCESLLSVANGIGTITVAGTILRKATALERMCGAVGVEQISEALTAAEASPDVKAVFLDIDSPGGTVGGVPELGEQVKEMTKTVTAYTDGQMCSAAYWLACNADEIVASQSAEIGSIGVYLPWVDQTIRYSLAGVKVDIIRNEGADLKGMGYPGTSLTPEQREHLQEGVNRIAEMFHAAVNGGRGNITADTMRGQAFMADDALNRGLIDDVATRSLALRKLTPTR